MKAGKEKEKKSSHITQGRRKKWPETPRDQEGGPAPGAAENEIRGAPQTTGGQRNSGSRQMGGKRKSPDFHVGATMPGGGLKKKACRGVRKRRN